MQKHVNLADLVKSFPTNIFLQNLASIQPRTSLVKFTRSPRTDRPGTLRSTLSPGFIKSRESVNFERNEEIENHEKVSFIEEKGRAGFEGVQGEKCQNQQILLARIGFDTAENGPSKVWV